MKKTKSKYESESEIENGAEKDKLLQFINVEKKHIFQKKKKITRIFLYKRSDHFGKAQESRGNSHWRLKYYHPI